MSYQRFNSAYTVGLLWCSAVLFALSALPAETLAQDRPQSFTAIQGLNNAVLQTPPTPARLAQRQPGVYQVQALTFYTDRATFEAAFPGLATEDFEESTVTFVTGCDEPFDENTNQVGCFAPGDILPGLEVWSLEKIRPGCAFESCPLVVLAPGVLGTPSKVVGANFFSDNTELQFTDPTTTAVGLDVHAGGGQEEATQVNALINVYGPSGLLGSTTVDATPAGAFIGAFSDTEPIERIEVITDGAGEVIDNVTFGSGVVDADLALDKVCEADAETNTASFHVELTNDGPNDATDVWVQDNLPEAIVITGWSTTQGTFDPFTGLWVVGTVADEGSAELWIDVSLQANGKYTNSAEVVAANEADPDSTPDNGDEDEDDYAACSFIKVGGRVVPDFVPGQSAGGVVDRGKRFTADLALSKTVDNATPNVGDQITYTISVFHQGPQPTAKVEVTDVLPGCLTFVSSSADRGSYNETTGIWDLGKIKPGETLDLDITVEISADCAGEVINTAEVTASSLPDPDDQFNIFEDPPVQDEIDSASINVSGRAVALDGTRFALGANYPNPFNPQTVVPFSLAEAADVSITVYDMLGRTVAVLVNGAMPAGVHEVTFEASQLPTGMYLVRMEAAGLVQTMHITLMK